MADLNAKIKIGAILKEERLKLGYTRDQIAERADIGTRYLIAIENDEKKPKFDVLYRLLHSLGISADKLFYPKITGNDDEDYLHLVRLLQSCNERDYKVVTAMIDTLVDTRRIESSE